MRIEQFMEIRGSILVLKFLPSVYSSGDIGNIRNMFSQEIFVHV